MPSYAKTIIQLINQLCREKYSNNEIGFVIKVYEFAVDLFTGQYQRSGQTQLAHCVGTSSILTSMHLPADLVAAGLIHNVYGVGDFGDEESGVTNLRRKIVRHSVGDKTEEYVFIFPTLQKKFLNLTLTPDNIDTLSDTDRKVMLIILADQVDHHVDYSRIYHQRNINKILEYINRYGDIMVEVAEKLGFPALGAELKRVFNETFAADIPQELLDHFSLTGHSTIIPKSYR